MELRTFLFNFSYCAHIYLDNYKPSTNSFDISIQSSFINNFNLPLFVCECMGCICFCFIFYFQYISVYSIFISQTKLQKLEQKSTDNLHSSEPKQSKKKRRKTVVGVPEVDRLKSDIEVDNITPDNINNNIRLVCLIIILVTKGICYRCTLFTACLNHVKNVSYVDMLKA